MRILSETLEHIKNTFIRAPIESGGIIGSRQGIICAFYFDEDNYRHDCYIPDVVKLNAKISEWADKGIQFSGLIHSHHNDCRHLSDSDKKYALAIRKSAGNIPLYFPVVTLCGEEAVLTAYSVSDNAIKREKIIIQR